MLLLIGKTVWNSFHKQSPNGRSRGKKDSRLICEIRLFNTQLGTLNYKAFVKLGTYIRNSYKIHPTTLSGS